MESRFRRLILRREKSTGTNDGSAVAGLPYHSSAPSDHQPIFIYQPLGKSNAELRNSIQANGMPLLSFAYESAPPGKAPIMGARPHKGNGPIKLQTNRRLSNGELIATTQDTQQTLQDIKEGDYIVGRKERPLSQATRQNTASTYQPLNSAAISSTQLGPLRHSVASPPHSFTWPLATVHEQSDSHPTGKSCLEFSTGSDLELSSSHVTSQPKGSMDVTHDFPPMSQGSTRRGSARSPVGSLQEPLQDRTATLRALWKAEYSRLVTIYGQDDADKNIALLDRESLISPKHPSTTADLLQATQFLEPLPKPCIDSQRGTLASGHTDRSSDASSDASSAASTPHRQSLASSFAETTSYITHTDVDESDISGARQDIRRMVEQMRSTFINAYEERVPKQARQKAPRRKRKAKLKISQTPPTTDDATNAPSTDLIQTPPQNQTTDTGNAAQHVTNTQQDCLASPMQQQGGQTGIRRADSTTLGSVVSELTREKIRYRQPCSGGSKAIHRVSRQSDKSTDGSMEGSSTTMSYLRPVTPTQCADTSRDSWLNTAVNSPDEIRTPLSYNNMITPAMKDPQIIYEGAPFLYRDLINDGHTEPRLIHEDVFDAGSDLTWNQHHNQVENPEHLKHLVSTTPIATIPALQTTNALPTVLL